MLFWVFVAGSPNGPTASSTYIRTTAHNRQFLWILYPIGFDEHVFGSSVNPSVLGTPFQDCTFYMNIRWFSYKVITTITSFISFFYTYM